MIISSGNNFGVETITIKDYQSERLIVLNSKFEIDTTNKAYLSADALEIYVPDLMLNKSAMTSCFLHTMYTKETPYGSYGCSPGTIVKTWIKNRNTICIEKLPIYDDIGHVTITLATLFVPKGKRLPIEKSQSVKINVTYQNNDAYESSLRCIVEDGWCFFHCVLDDTGDYFDDDIIMNLEGFPTDVSAEIILSGCQLSGDHMGAGTYSGKIENGVITIPKLCNSGYSTGRSPFIFFYAVRDKQTENL